MLECAGDNADISLALDVPKRFQHELSVRCSINSCRGVASEGAPLADARQSSAVAPSWREMLLRAQRNVFAKVGF